MDANASNNNLDPNFFNAINFFMSNFVQVAFLHAQTQSNQIFLLLYQYPYNQLYLNF